MKIAIYDSGIGGLSVLHNAKRQFPNEEFLYYADEDNVPYGEKTKEQITAFAQNAVKFLLSKGACAVVIACNTATSAAAPLLRSQFDIPIIGMEPAVKVALDNDHTHRVIAAATPVTVSGHKMKVLLERYDNHHLVDLLPMPGLVRFAEAGNFDGDDVYRYTADCLSQFELSNYSAFVLGCTHFNLFKGVFRDILPDNVAITDGNSGTVRQLSRKLKESGAVSSKAPKTTYYFSGREVTDKKELNKIDNIMMHLDKVYDIG